MRITHTDRAGGRWVFDLSCTPYMANLFRRLLRSIRSVGSHEALTLSYLTDAQANDDFLRNAELAILQALKDWAAAGITQTPAPKYEAPDILEIPTVRLTEANTDTTGDRPAPTAEAETPVTVEEREPYYWERDNF